MTSSAPPAPRPPHAPRAPRSAFVSLASRAETLHVRLGGAGAVVGAIVGAIVLRGTAPLGGAGSIGQVAAVSVLACGSITAALVLTVLAPEALAFPHGRHRVRRTIDTIGLSLLFGVLGLFLVSALFGVFQSAFVGVALDRFAGAFWVAAATGAACYVISAAVSALDGRSLATLLAVFMTVGVLTSAMNAPDPYWWERYFSELGEGEDTASLIFNMTLLLTGAALVVVAELIAHDLSRWAAAAGEPRWKTTVVSTLLTALGVLVALVALISRTVSVLWHDVVAQTLVIVFGITLLVVPALLRRLPGALLPVTVGALGLLLTAVVLYLGPGYLNMTAFEMGAAVIVYVWLLLFIRMVAAAAAGVDEHAAAAEG
ncbi:hypothetical protein ACXET9_04225 [Brachybacterium sp. DNPG3]